jgi:hypothetical protein
LHKDDMSWLHSNLASELNGGSGERLLTDQTSNRAVTAR